MANTLLTPKQDQRFPEAPWPGLSDQALCARAGTGDLQAFAALYDRHERRVFSLCLAITASPEQASEATQEAFLGLLDHARQDPDFPGEDFRTFLLEATRDASVEALQSGRWSPLEDLPEPIPARFTPERERDDAERSARRSDHDDRVLAAIASLPVNEREVLALLELEQCSDDEIAQLTVLDPNTVPQMIRDAGVHLCDQLDDQAPALDPINLDPVDGGRGEVGHAYGALLGLAPIPALRRLTLVRAWGPIGGFEDAPEDGSSAAGRGLTRIPPFAATGLILLLGLAYSGASGVISGGPSGGAGSDGGIDGGFSSPLSPNPSDAGLGDGAATSTVGAPPDSGQPPAGNDQPGDGKPPAKGKPDPSGQNPPDPTPPPPPDPTPPPPPDPPPPPLPGPPPGPFPPIIPPGLFGP